MNVILFDKRRLMLFEPPSLTVLQPEPRSKSNAKPMETWKMNWQQKLKLYIEDGKISRNVVLPKFGFKWIFHYKSNMWMRVKIQSMDQGPGPTHDPYSMIHTPIHTP
jgi:hypothetical protein